MRALLGHTLQTRLADEARLPEQQFVPEQVGKAGVGSLGSRLSLREHLLAQTSLFPSGPHLLGCLLDCVLYILQ